jgi:hypothetical protein
MDSAMHMCGHGQDMCKGELQVGWLENRCSGSAQWTGSADACKIAEPLPPAEEPPSAPAMSPTHAPGAIAYLQVTSGSMLESREGGEQPDEQMETSLRQLESQHVHSKPCTARAEQVLLQQPTHLTHASCSYGSSCGSVLHTRDSRTTC